MNNKFSPNIARWFRYVARGILLLVTGFWFVFALLSGAEDYGGGLNGLLQNLPNALPWLLLLVFNFPVWKWEFVGGLSIMLIGLFFSFFFDLWETDWGGLFIIFVPIELVGLMFIACWWLDRHPKQRVEVNS
jgi:hypothetical protein